MQMLKEFDSFDRVWASEVAGKGKRIRSMWLDEWKGDEVRSRLVAKEVKLDKREDLFAATPPIEALKLLISLWMTRGIGKRGSKKMNQ